MVNHRGVKLYRKQPENGKCTDVTNRIYTQSRTFQFSFPASSSIPLAVAATLILFSCSTWYCVMTSRARQTTMISWRRRPLFHSSYTLLVELKDFELFKKPMGWIAKPPLTIFLCNPFLAKALLLEKSFSVCLTRI